ncbi:MAG: hypothetical protein P8X98_03155 [Woeseiaceae bacterium]
MLENFRPEYVLLVLFALIVGWFLLRFLLKFTARLFTCGCLALAVLGVGWILFTVLR